MAEKKPEPAAEEQADKKSGGGGKLIVILLIVVILLLAGVLGGGAWLLMSGKLGGAPAAPVAEQHAEDGHGDDGHGEEKPKKKKKKEDDPHAAPTYTVVGDEKAPFTVNLAETSAADYLQVEVQVLSSDPAVPAAIKSHLPALKASLNALFSQQKSTEIKTAQGREQLRQQALESVRKVLEKQADVDPESIEDVLFTSFVMQ
ncbi:MAG: flagellar basal body-associated FliL family protein [Pseudomonadota bacterium]